MAKKRDLVRYDVVYSDGISKLSESMMRAQFSSRCESYNPDCLNCKAWHIWDLERELKSLKSNWDM